MYVIQVMAQKWWTIDTRLVHKLIENSTRFSQWVPFLMASSDLDGLYRPRFRRSLCDIEYLFNVILGEMEQELAYAYRFKVIEGQAI